MAINRVQMQRGLSMMEFMLRYGSQAQCQPSLAAGGRPDGFVCPACQAHLSTPSSCGHQTTVWIAGSATNRAGR